MITFCLHYLFLLYILYLFYSSFFFFFFFNDTATTEIYTLSLHDALPIWRSSRPRAPARSATGSGRPARARPTSRASARSEEHTSELQSQSNLVCRLLLEKKKKKKNQQGITTLKN